MKKRNVLGVLVLVMATSVMLVACDNDSGVFSQKRILVALTEEASVIDKVWQLSDFPEFAFSKIYDVGLVGSQRFLRLYLPESKGGEANKVLYLLRNRAEISSASIEAPGGS